MINMDKYKLVRSKMTGLEATNAAIKDVAVQFATWTWTNNDESLLGLPFDELFEYWLNNIYNHDTSK